MTLHLLRSLVRSETLHTIVRWALFLMTGAIYAMAYRRGAWAALLAAGLAFGIATVVVADLLPLSGSDEP